MNIMNILPYSVERRAWSNGEESTTDRQYFATEAAAVMYWESHVKSESQLAHPTNNERRQFSVHDERRAARAHALIADYVT